MSRGGTGAREQVGRLLTLVPLLHARGELALAEAAETLGTTPAQVVKDLKVLLMCGLPGGMPDDLIDVDLDALEGDEGVVHVWNADYLAQPVRLSPTEATALVVALRALRDTSSVEAQEVVDRALAKLEQAAAEGSAHAQVAIAPQVAHDTSDADTREQLTRAVAERRQVRLDYWVPSRDEKTDRVVDPIQVTTVASADYLEAHCHSAGARRVFRLDRIDRVEVLDSRVADEARTPNDLSVHLFDPPSDSITVTLRLGRRARWVPDYYPVDQVRALDEGQLEVDLRVADLRWLQQLVLRLAPDAQIVSPPELAQEATRAARNALALYA